MTFSREIVIQYVSPSGIRLQRSIREKRPSILGRYRVTAYPLLTNVSGRQILAGSNLANGDTLVGTLQGQLRLETEFDTLTISSGEIKRLVSLKTGPGDVQVVLWDDSVVAGQLREPDNRALLRDTREVGHLRA